MTHCPDTDTSKTMVCTLQDEPAALRKHERSLRVQAPLPDGDGDSAAVAALRLEMSTLRSHLKALQRRHSADVGGSSSAVMRHAKPLFRQQYLHAYLPYRRELSSSLHTSELMQRRPSKKFLGLRSGKPSLLPQGVPAASVPAAKGKAP